MFNSDIHHRRSSRLAGYDYSQKGLYFVTICAQNRLCLFGNVGATLVVALSTAGKMVEKQWGQLSNRYPNICLHNFVVMPNHFHGIIEITNRINVGATLVVAPGTDNSPTAGNVTTTVGRATADGDATTESRATTRVAPTVGDVVGAFKSITTVEYIKGVNDDGWRPFEKRLWQRNYFEHIIRDEPEYLRIAEYIENNPIKWNEDRYYEEF